LKPKVVHNEAMDYSFRAKKALDNGNSTDAFELYKKAADLESQVAEFYFDKPELEPTRSVVVRSAAFLNLKAGNIEQAKKFIFFGLLNTSDELIAAQLNNALELAISLKNETSKNASSEFMYLNLLRQRSINYVLEPTTPEYGKSVSLDMIREFSEFYLKSLKAYAIAKYKRLNKTNEDTDSSIFSELSKIINPLVTASAYGSFKFSIANDYLERLGESKELVKLKSNIVSKYHHEIFSNRLGDEDIESIKEEYSDGEINEIFKPLTKIKSNKTPYKIGYYDNENYQKTFSDRIINKQKKKLLTVNKISQDDIGELESSIVHKRSSDTGKVTKKTLVKKQLKSYEFDLESNLISNYDQGAIILNEEIIINVLFDSENGFSFSFDDLEIENVNVEYEKGLKDFYAKFYNKVLNLARNDNKSEKDLKAWSSIEKLIGNPDKLRE
jgi:hypothetical protein